MNRNIFISHRESDKAIADIIRKNLERWGISSQEIFQSSSAQYGAMIGETIDKQLKEKINKAKVVILVYTYTDEDWSWCMWECGVAIDPDSEKPKRRIVVFQCANQAPKPFQDKVLVKIAKEDIQRFTEQFHKGEFFPGEEVYGKETSQDLINERSEILYNELLSTCKHHENLEIYRWDSFTLELKNDILEEVKVAEEEDAVSIIKNGCIVIMKENFNVDILRHFGYQEYEPNIKLADLEERWRNAVRVRENISRSWAKQLCLEILLTIKNAPPSSSWEPLQSARFSTLSWFYLILNRARKSLSGEIEFDIYLHQFDGFIPLRNLDNESIRWDCLTLKLRQDIANEIRIIKEEEHCLEIIQNECTVGEKTHGDTLRHFGYQIYELDLTLAKLISRWSESVQRENNAPTEWIKELCLEIKRAINNAPPAPSWQPLKSVIPDTNWLFYMILNRVIKASDDWIEFDIYLYRAPS